MAAPVPLRSDFDAEALRILANGARDAAQTRHLLALSAIYAGGSRTEATAFAGSGFRRAWAIGSSRPVRAITPRTRTPSRLLKKLPRPPGGDRASHRRQADRSLVRRRGSGRPEEHDHPALGQARHAPRGPQGPAHRFRLHLRSQMPRPRQRGGPRHPPLHHRGNEPASGRDCPGHRPGRARRAVARSGRVAHDQETRGACQHNSAAAAGPRPRTKPGGEPVAVHTRQLARQSDLQLLRRHPRLLLQRLELPHRPTIPHHVHRTAQPGSWILISES
ncbi:hypothetical protein SAMN04488144_1518 [Methylobacterium sp. 190mf]|nr:hypothetical protein SAMN04488144_1518 [Methylobacterium sp. 190mf]